MTITAGLSISFCAKLLSSWRRWERSKIEDPRGAVQELKAMVIRSTKKTFTMSEAAKIFGISRQKEKTMLVFSWMQPQ